MIGSDVAIPTSLGTGTAKIQLGGADLVLPAWARSILAVRPTLITGTPVTDEGVLAYLTLESDDIAIQPYLVLCNPIPVGAATSEAIFAGEPPWYPVNAPVNGGDRLKIYGTSLNAITTGGHMSCQVVISDKKAGGQIHAKIGAVTATGTVASVDVNEASYTITGGNRLIEIVGVACLQAVATVDTLFGRFEFISNDFKFPTPLKLPTNPIQPSIGGGTEVSALTPGLSRAKVDVPILSPCQLTNNLNMVIAPTAAGNFITGVLYQ